MNVPSPLSSNRDSLSSRSVTSSESDSSGEQKRSSNISNKSGRRISISNSRNRPSTVISNSKKYTLPISDQSSHKISPVPFSGTLSQRSCSVSSKNKSALSLQPSAEPVLEVSQEVFPTLYEPTPCTTEYLCNINLEEYENFSSNAELGNDELIVFENNTITTRSLENLLLSS